MWKKFNQLLLFNNNNNNNRTSKSSLLNTSSSSNNSQKRLSWPLGIILLLPFLIFIILHNNNTTDDEIINYSGGGGNNIGVHSLQQQQQQLLKSNFNVNDYNNNNNNENVYDDDDDDENNNNNNNNNNNYNGSDLLSSSLSAQKSSDDCICDMNNNNNNNKDNNHHQLFIPNQPLYDNKNVIIFIITPTYTRPTQMADMTRLSQTLQLVSNIFWIVVEDAHNKSRNVENLLQRTNKPYVHLLGPRPPTHLDKRSGRGVSNRLRAFEWLRENYSNTTQSGVIYFADDDNAYDIRIFDEMRSTKIVSMFPVGLISTLGLSTPIVSRKSGKIIGFHDPFIGRRKFAVDMAGFAVNLQYFLLQKKSTMPYKVGYEEDYFLKSLGVKIWQLEPKANNCTEILVWHTKTKPSDQPKLSLMKKVLNYNETNLPDLYANQLQLQ